ncbi:hypothetical protein GCM10025869_31160 [Homoserinibacter gongjuensis]|uniref:DUF2567 domain-containing protein n=1 Tax=Homoserinibacter gongjuensis TaxID=1162968 RepID=A0ABQ6JY44_9MICO|nr:hypothetical protein GCM10025869_31160 [Homoserinibacter gongjuensis]
MRCDLRGESHGPVASKRTRAVSLLAVVMLTLAPGYIGAYWAWVALPDTVDPSLLAAWERMGGMNPLLLVFTAFLAVCALALFAVAVIRVVRDRSSGRASVWGACTWGCFSGSGAAVASTLPGLAIIVYVERVIPGFMAGAVPDDLSVINGIRLALAPALLSAAALCWLARSAARRGAGVPAAVPAER